MKPLALHQSSRLVDRIEIATPCSARWQDMAGDERVRHCGLCAKNVYNLEAMSAAEAAALLVETEGRACVRLYRRKDGTVLTSDCPVGLAERAWRRARSTALASLALVVSLFGGALAFGSARQTGDVVDQRYMAGGLKAPEPERRMGEMAPIPDPMR